MTDSKIREVQIGHIINHTVLAAIMDIYCRKIERDDAKIGNIKL